MSRLYDTINRGHEIEADKARHFVVGSFISALVVVLNHFTGSFDSLIEICAVIVSVFTIAALWEAWQMVKRDMYDRKYLNEAFRDVIATTAGCLPVVFSLLTKI